jgi:cytochrome subunit of sulfide dehydrogenase
MKFKLTTSLLVVLISTGYFACAFAEPAQYITDCMNCHGKDGVSNEADMPTIAGASAAFIESTLFAYKDNIRPAIESHYRMGDIRKAPTDMKKIVANLSDEQISEIANFYAKKPFVAAKQAFNSALVADGLKVHELKCQKCHNQGGSDPDDDSGILAGQHSQYLRQSMKHYLDGSREMDKKMKQKTDQLKDGEWQALIAYYASQQ